MNIKELISDYQYKKNLYLTKAKAYSVLINMVEKEDKITRKFLNKLWNSICFGDELNLFCIDDLDKLKDVIDKYEKGGLNDEQRN